MACGRSQAVFPPRPSFHRLAARAPADGYTLLMGISTLAMNAATFKKVPYDALRDFVPITQAAVQALL